MDTWQKSMPCTGGQTQGAWVAPALVSLGSGVILYNEQNGDIECGGTPGPPRFGGENLCQ